MYHLHLGVPEASGLLYNSLFQQLHPSFHRLWGGHHFSTLLGVHMFSLTHFTSVSYSHCIPNLPECTWKQYSCIAPMSETHCACKCEPSLFLNIRILFYLCCSQSSHPFAGELPIQTSNSSLCHRQNCSGLSGSVFPFRSMICGHQLPFPNRSIHAFLLRKRNISLSKWKFVVLNRWVRVSLIVMWDFSKNLNALGQLAKRFFGGRAKVLQQGRNWCVHSRVSKDIAVAKETGA